MSTLARYRQIVPAHAAVDDAVVEVELGLAIDEHSRSAWGTAFDDGMVWFAAHHIEMSPAVQGSAQPAQITSQRDGDLARSYGSVTRGDGDDFLRTTTYGQRYLGRRAKLAAGKPRWVSA